MLASTTSTVATLPIHTLPVRPMLCNVHALYEPKPGWSISTRPPGSQFAVASPAKFLVIESDSSVFWIKNKNDQSQARTAV